MAKSGSNPAIHLITVELTHIRRHRAAIRITDKSLAIVGNKLPIVLAHDLSGFRSQRFTIAIDNVGSLERKLLAYALNQECSRNTQRKARSTLRSGTFQCIPGPGRELFPRALNGPGADEVPALLIRAVGQVSRFR